MLRTAIYFPMLALALLTVLVALWLGFRRGRAVAAGAVAPDYFRIGRGDAPEAMVAAARCYGNLLELPVLFYTVCLALLALGLTDYIYLTLAWVFVALRVVQALIHLTFNDPRIRGLVFIIGLVVVAIMWVRLGLRLGLA